MTPEQTNTPNEEQVALERPLTNHRLSTGQLSLRTVLLLTTLAAIFVAWWQNGKSDLELNQKIAVSRKFLNELVIDDPLQYAATKLTSPWMGVYIWDVHLPHGYRYSLHLSTDGIDETNFPEKLRTIPISSGRHQIQLDASMLASENQLPITIDSSEPIVVPVTREGKNYSSTSNGVNQSMQQSMNKPLVLYRMRYMKPGAGGAYSPTNGPEEGALFWIECED